MTVANWVVKDAIPALGWKQMYFEFTAGSADTVTISGLSTIKGGAANYWTGTTVSGGGVLQALIYSGNTITVASAGSFMGVCWGQA